MLYSLAEENYLGKTLATTTTMMRHPRIGKHPFRSVQIESISGWPSPDTESPCLIADSLATGQTGKIRGFSPDNVDNWQKERWPLTLIEADGASERALKMPADHEPQIPRSTTVVIGVIGLDILGRTASAATIHRFPLVQKRIGLQEGESVRLKHIFRIINHPEGLFKDTPPGARKILVLNKSDVLSRKAAISPNEIIQSIPDQCPSIGMILLTELLDYTQPKFLNLNKTRSLHVPF